MFLEQLRKFSFIFPFVVVIGGFWSNKKGFKGFHYVLLDVHYTI
jgi:hypothetical protein